MNKLKKNISNKKKIIIFSVGRSDIGILTNLIKKIEKDPKFDLDLAICVANNTSKFGLFKNELKFNSKKIFYLRSKYSGSQNKDIINYFSNHLYFSNKLFDKKKYDAAIIMGDRYEMLSISVVCLNYQIPIMHFCGGSITRGSIDNTNRYCISLMSTSHFVETKFHKQNLIRHGISKNIFVVGAPALENFQKKLLSKKQIEQKFKIKMNNKFMICTFHPETTISADENINNLLELINFLNNCNYFKIFTYPNADQGFTLFIDLIKKKLDLKNVLLIKNLGKKNYYSLLKYSNLVIGNSSSGIIECASFKLPVINLGNRQKGRYFMKNVIHCEFDKNKIAKAFKLSQSMGFLKKIKKIKNDYEMNNTSSNSIKIIHKLLSNKKN